MRSFGSLDTTGSRLSHENETCVHIRNCLLRSTAAGLMPTSQCDVALAHFCGNGHRLAAYDVNTDIIDSEMQNVAPPMKLMMSTIHILGLWNGTGSTASPRGLRDFVENEELPDFPGIIR
jgi:hypothetical protein